MPALGRAGSEMHVRAVDSSVDLLDLHRHAPSRYPALFESSAGGPHGQWDLLLVASGDALQLHADGGVRDHSGRRVGQNFFDALDVAWRRDVCAERSEGFPFLGGWAVLLAYEAAAQVERVLELPAASGAVPMALALRCPAALLRDRVTGAMWVVAEPAHATLLAQVESDIEKLIDSRPPPPHWQRPELISEDDADTFLSGVERALDYIAAGDVFQVNLSRSWLARFDAPVDAAGLFARLRHANPAPFAGVFSGAGWSVVSASPERLVSVHDGVVQTRPIAGTRPRLADDADAERIRELIAHPKERAEHVMLIDLERNDLGRVSVPGSVEVDELMGVESYAHVHHIVSNVRGVLRDGVTPGEVMRAVFPGGTITGCPKVRCMQIIAELEGAGRGAYTGSMGWLGNNGDMDLNILIRSAEVQGGQVRFRTGAGIVADSDPQRELEETRAKARGMLRALDDR